MMFKQFWNYFLCFFFIKKIKYELFELCVYTFSAVIEELSIAFVGSMSVMNSF